MRFSKSQSVQLFLVTGSVFVFTACSFFSPSQQTDLQNRVAQTEQGIDVGLKIYDPNLQTEQTQQQTQDTLKITVLSPDLSQPLKSPVTIHGKVSGLYFSEGVFPVVLRDDSGNEIARVQAQADGEWMTRDVVPFTAELVFTAPSTPNARLVFMKDNPSGLPENDSSQSFDVTLQ